MSLKTRLIEQITLEGPISIADYMTQCLLDPIDGYYMKRPALGADGDFITAPMVSQMFGEMLGVWVAQVWQNLGAPERFRLVEVGGGDGTLMSDMLRVAERVPGLRAAADVVMIEPSPVLRNLQSQKVPHAVFQASLDALPQGLPVILVANEVLDCLPARQFVRTETGWYERRIGVQSDELVFGLAATEFTPPFEAAIGEIVEVSAPQLHFAQQIAHLLKAATGAALLIDYGRAIRETGDTLQALHRHQKHLPLAAPGAHDLTVWADFPAVAEAARQIGIKVSAITSQAAFLHALGIDARLAALQARHPEQNDKLQRQFDRLIAPDQMGELFKAVAFASSDTIALPGLEAAGDAA
ncbi:MAG TPA: SAM-dependent methyltransferase [Asticcacaulis sp.]|nr:SAM-dependent methyltransferase [Asticcacaulis sp.]